MQKIKFFILFFFIFSLLKGNSQQQNVKDTDKGASLVLKELLVKYNAFKTIVFEFTIKVENETKVLSSYDGTLYIKDKKYYVAFNDQIFACDTTMIWNYQKSSNEITIYEFEEEEDPIFHPVKMLANWEDEYYAKYIDDIFENNKKMQIIDLQPKKRKSYYKIRIYIDQLKKEIARVIIYEKDNTAMTYYITKQTANTSIPDSQFVFDRTKFPNVQINDMR